MMTVSLISAPLAETAGASSDDSEREPADPDLKAHAALLEKTLPALNRQLFATDHPLADLPLAQLRLCSLLAREGRRTMSQIGEDLAISVSAVTQMADRLEKAGMVERTAEPGGDRRTRHLQLTPHGEALMRSRREMRTHRAEAVLRHLSPEKRTLVMEALGTLLETLQAQGTVNAPALVPSLRESV